MLFLGLLLGVNALVFGAGGGVVDGLPSASLQRTRSALAPVAEAPDDACSTHPVRVFDGLDDLIRLQGSLSQGRTLRLGLLQLGLAAADIDAVEAAVRPMFDLGRVRGSGAALRVAVDRGGGVQALEIELAEGHLLQACRGPRGMVARQVRHPARTDVAVVGFELGRAADLAAAVAAAGEQGELADRIAEALASDVDLMTESRPGDRFAVMVEKRWVGREFHRYGALLALRYVGGGGRLAYYRYVVAGRPAELYDREGKAARRTLLRSPVRWHRIDPEGRGLLAPRIEHVQGRIGAVYRLPEGAPVAALGDGIVRSAGDGGLDGIVVELEHADGSRSRYARLLRSIGELEPGTAVRQGQIVGLAGRSGITAVDGVRLELVAPDGTTLLDPSRLGANAEPRLPRQVPDLPAAVLEAFAADVEPWAKALRRAG